MTFVRSVRFVAVQWLMKKQNRTSLQSLIRVGTFRGTIRLPPIKLFLFASLNRQWKLPNQCSKRSKRKSLLVCERKKKLGHRIFSYFRFLSLSFPRRIKSQSCYISEKFTSLWTDPANSRRKRGLNRTESWNRVAHASALCAVSSDRKRERDFGSVSGVIAREQRKVWRKRRKMCWLGERLTRSLMPMHRIRPLNYLEFSLRTLIVTIGDAIVEILFLCVLIEIFLERRNNVVNMFIADSVFAVYDDAS